jgi:hypothetical protein
MLQIMRRLFGARQATTPDQDRALLRAKLIAVAVARATHYGEATH